MTVRGIVEDAGDAQIVRTEFGRYGKGTETTIRGLNPSSQRGIDVSFFAITNDSTWLSITKTFFPEPVKAYVNTDNVGSTSCVLRGFYDIIDATKNYSGFEENGYNSDVLEFYGLDPEKEYTSYYYVNTKEGGTVSAHTIYRTNKLVFETEEAQTVSDKRARISAKVNAEDDGLRFGFEWRRYDAPDLVPSTKSPCPVYNGYITGTLNNLSPNVYYMYRPYYTSDSGKTYYGSWIAFGTADAYVYFEPEVHTYEARNISARSVLLKGFALPGSDDVVEQGFEYWIDKVFAKSRTRIGEDEHRTITASGMLMSATVEDLEPSTVYRFRSYLRTSKETSFGEEMTFTTVEDLTGIGDVVIESDVPQVEAYYDLQGHRLNAPENGVIIIRYIDGSTRKVLIK